MRRLPALILAGSLLVALPATTASATPIATSSWDTASATGFGHPAPEVAGEAELVSSFNIDTEATQDLGDGLASDAPVGGFSALARIDDTHYLALSDDRGDKGPSRIYPLEITGVGTPGEAVTIQAPIVLTDTDGKEYAPGTIDPEGLRVLSDGTLLISSEGDASKGIDPAVIHADAQGRALNEFEIPEYHKVGENSGIENNRAYEGLALSPDETQALVLTENALTQDSDLGLNRLTVYDIATGTPVHEYTYQPSEGIPGNGATELLGQGDGSYLVLERGYIDGVGNPASIHRISVTEHSTDVLGKAQLDGGEVSVDKKEVFDFNRGGFQPDNVEGMAPGPQLKDGRNSVLVVSDNNFSASQTTWLHTVALP